MSTPADTHWYGAFANYLFTKQVDISADTFNAILMTGYTQDQDTEGLYSDIVAFELGGGTAPTGYTNGGQALTSVTFTYDAGTNTWGIGADPLLWSSLDHSTGVNGIVVYHVATGALLFNVQHANQVGTGNFEVDWNAGIAATVNIG